MMHCKAALCSQIIANTRRINRCSMEGRRVWQQLLHTGGTQYSTSLLNCGDQAVCALLLLAISNLLLGTDFHY